MRFSRRALGALVALQASVASACIKTVEGTILVLARDDAGIKNAAAGLEGYGIHYEGVTVPQAGITLPQLNSSIEQGNYGGIVVIAEVSYDFSGSWRSALTAEQWEELYTYQVDFGVRMVRLDVFPTPAFGVLGAGDGLGCCNDPVDQLVSISDDSEFPTANLKVGAGLTTDGLWHYPAEIVDTATTFEFAQFAPTTGFPSPTSAGVINKIDGRQQMVFFTSWASEWAIASNFLQHAFIHWLTRGLFSGKRKTYLGTQVDDVHLATGLYHPAGTEFRLRTGDLDAHVTWQADINSRLPSGSDYFVELAHNGNGALIAATGEGEDPDPSCDPSYPVYYDTVPDVPYGWKKPIGSGVDFWDEEWVTYPWVEQCPAADDFAAWFLNTANRDAYGHVSHTFTHEEMNNATYRDAELETQFNQAWLEQMGYTDAAIFSPQGLVPPAITGLNNGDAIKAWMDNGINHVVGDNTRPPLRNKDSQYWPLITNVEENGYAGLVVIPRWATTIYYNCDFAECTTKEWIDTSGGAGDFDDLLIDAKNVNTRYLLALHPDPYMFHQANMRQTDAPEFTVGPVSGKLSLLTIWVETITQELTRLTDWPVQTLKHDDIAQLFLDRMALDSCNPNIEYIFDHTAGTITGINVKADGNSCGVNVPVTLPGAATSSAGGVVLDQRGSEPTIAWTPLSGSAVTFNLDTAIPV